MPNNLFNNPVILGEEHGVTCASLEGGVLTQEMVEAAAIRTLDVHWPVTETGSYTPPQMGESATNNDYATDFIRYAVPQSGTYTINAGASSTTVAVTPTGLRGLTATQVIHDDPAVPTLAEAEDNTSLVGRLEKEISRLRKQYKDSLVDWQEMDKRRRKVSAELEAERNSSKALQKQCYELTAEINNMRNILFESGLLK